MAVSIAHKGCRHGFFFWLCLGFFFWFCLGFGKRHRLVRYVYRWQTHAVLFVNIIVFNFRELPNNMEKNIM